MMLVTLDQAKRHLQMDHDVDDQDILDKIAQASGAVLTYMQGAPIGRPQRDSQGAVVLDSQGDVVYEQDSTGIFVRREIEIATLLLLAEFYKNREGKQDGEIAAQWGYGYLPRPVVALLFPLRKPALA